jgi:hypothetical protein
MKKTIIAGLITTLPFAVSAKEMEFSAFFDVQLQTVNTEAEETFLLNDASFYMDYEKEKYSIHLDLPFANASDDNLNNSVDGQISFGEAKAQYYSVLNLSDSLSLTFGQFDSIVGYEENDSNTLEFAQVTSNMDNMFPDVQMGMMLNYQIGDINMGATIANKGGKANTQGDGTEYGVTASYESDVIEGYVSYLTFSDKGDDATDESENLTDIYVGIPYGDFMLSLEHAISDQKDKDPGMGNYVKLAYSANEKTTYLIRYIETQNINNAKETYSYALGVKYDYSDNHIMKLNYIKDSSKAPGAMDYTDEDKFVFGLITSF